MPTKNVGVRWANNQWLMEYNGTYGPGNYPVIKVPQDGGPHFISFTIKGGAATFGNDPIWIADGGKPNKANSDHDQIVSWKVKGNGKKLVVFDWNDRAGEIHYQLNFSDGTTLDPVIENGGGTGGQPIFGESAGAVLLIALVAFVLGAWFFRRLDNSLHSKPKKKRTKANEVG